MVSHQKKPRAPRKPTKLQSIKKELRARRKQLSAAMREVDRDMRSLGLKKKKLR